MRHGQPTNGTAEQIMAKALTNQALSQRIGMIRNNRHSLDKATADAILDEAATRLMWRDVYDNHAIKAGGK